MNFTQPKYLAEANIQAEIYLECKSQNIECYLEYRHENCRFDLVIVKNDSIIGIIEVKKTHHATTKKKLKIQREKYKRFGIPVHFCFHRGDIPYTMKIIQSWIDGIAA